MTAHLIVLRHDRYLLLLPLRHPHQVILSAEGFSRSRSAHIVSIRLQDPRFRVVRHISRQNLISQPLVKVGLQDREDYLATLNEVPRHPVRAAAIDLLVAAVGEAEDPAMLQKPPYDAAYSYPFA